MPTHNPTSFASAAASNGTGEGGSGRNGAGSVDWSRPRVNGSQTFRRSSQLNTLGHPRDSSSTAQTPSSGVYVPPHMNPSSARSSSVFDSRYSKDQLLDIFKTQSENQTFKDVSSVLTEGWVPGQPAQIGSTGWGRRDDNKDQNAGPEICWDDEGYTKPLGLTDMTDEEKELFTTSVNSLLKPPQQNTNKEGAQTPGVNGRKSSVSQAAGILSSGRPGNRRRDTTDSFSGNPLASPTFARGGGRDDNPLANLPPSLLRRRTDVRDGGIGTSDDKGKGEANAETRTPFASLRRTSTNPLSAGSNGLPSPWTAEPQSAGGFGRMGSFGVLDQPGTPGEKRPGFGSLRGESRFLRDLRSKDDNEDVGKMREKTGLFGLDKLAEESHPPSQEQSRMGQREEGQAQQEQPGSAALGGDDSSPPNEHSFLPGFGRQQKRDDTTTGFGAPSNLPPFRERAQRETSRQHDLSSSFQEPMSPTDTNPYQSPEHERINMDRLHDDDRDSRDMLPHGYSQTKPATFDLSDAGSRSSSTVPPRTVSGLSGLGGIGSGWVGAPGPLGLTGQPRPPFSESLFGSLGDLGSPNTGGVFGQPSISNQPGFGSGRSKLSSLFTPQMQDQMRGNEPRQDVFGSFGGANLPPGETDSPAGRSSRNLLDDLFGGQGSKTGAPAPSPFGPNDGLFGQGPQQAMFSTTIGTPAVGAPSQQLGGSAFFGPTADNDPTQLPPAQQRQMVMPDKMRWIYRDPQGNKQGPWSGLEMHDWYRAGFFSPELQVKKLEDADYEPLAQLIRRIGNSREPFLVPQIGIPHGPAVTGQPNAAPPVGAPTITAGPGSVQPPFASSFPSFGTTLTAEQQNALERRKQEEQYLMAQQKEFLQQKQQLMRTQMQYPTAPGTGMHGGQLQHHSSAQSLQSQPSFGSMGGSAGGFPPGPAPGAQPSSVPGFFDVHRTQHTYGPVGAAQLAKDEELAGSFDRMSLGRGTQSPFGVLGSMMQTGMGHDGASVTQMLQDRARLQQEQYDAFQRGQDQDPNLGFDRLQEFSNLREQEGAPAGIIGKPQPQQSLYEDDTTPQPTRERMQELELTPHRNFLHARPEPVTMPSRDVTDARTSTPEADVPAPQSAWGSIEKPKPQPLDVPAPSISPLPAPAAQRANRHVAEALAAESRSRSQTPSVETPSASLAPWAKETTEPTRGPSLKEIQEAEARKAAQQEALLGEQRRQHAEAERLAHAAVSAPAPGLPSTASWGAAAGTNSPVTPSGSAWVKTLAGKAGTPAGPAKKTLAQIQKEEEARKNRAAAAAAAIAAQNAAGNLPSTGVVGGKRYAELASKGASPSPGPAAAGPAGGGAWTTVGAGGKVKTPGSAAAVAANPVSRSVSGAVPTVAATAGATVKKSTTAGGPAKAPTSVPSAGATALEELQRWMRGALGKPGALNSGISADELVKSLMLFPLDVEIIGDTIYAASSTLDGRRLAEEFVRRRTLADKGIVADGGSTGGASVSTPSATGGSASGNGWNEVAKKSSVPTPTAQPEPGFKMVAPKKKGGKR